MTHNVVQSVRQLLHTRVELLPTKFASHILYCIVQTYSISLTFFIALRYTGELVFLRTVERQKDAPTVVLLMT